jgi:diadenylate cyclase
MAGVDADRTLVIRDYLPAGKRSRLLEEALDDLDELSANEMIDLTLVARSLGFPGTAEALDSAVSPRGFRLLAKVPPAARNGGGPAGGALRQPAATARRTVEDLQAVDGVGDARARGVREGLSRLAEASILERYV